MRYFQEEFKEFFNQLSINNNKEWFHANKTEYETHVKIPFEKFVNQLIIQISKHEDLKGITAKQCIGRIHKDIRFSKDKTPYNTHINAFISPAGSKDKSIPGLFLRFSPEMIGIMCGAYCPSKQQTERIRKHIANNLSKFESLHSQKKFYYTFGEIKGETIKRIPEQWKEVCKLEKLILNKQWYFVAEREPEIFENENLIEEIMNYYIVAKPLNDFLKIAIKQ